jgi:acetyl/propionyl-CoA carboxylase alpha subunit
MAKLMRDGFKIGDREYSLWLSKERYTFRVHLPDVVLDVALEQTCGVQQLIVIDGRAHAITVARHGDRTYIHLDGEVYEVDHFAPLARFAGNIAHSKSDHLLAPMPGSVIACPVKPGDVVEAGELLLVIESMKLETPFMAWRGGCIAAVHVETGQTFERDRVLLSMAPAEAA